MAFWQVQLKGSRVDLENLHERWRITEATVSLEGNRYYLQSAAFEELTTAEEVLSEAQDLVGRLNGLMRLSVSGYQPVSAITAEWVRDDGTSHYFDFGGISVVRVTTSGTDTAPGIHPNPGPGDTSVKLLQITADHPELQLALSLFGARSRDWVTLYKIFEIMRNTVGGEDQLKRVGGVPDSQIGRFTRTANHPCAGGDSARHAVSRATPPKNPMSLAEGDKFIRDLLSRWIESCSADHVSQDEEG